MTKQNETPRAALYLRVSTTEQTVENQRLALTETAERKGWQIVGEYTDNGISGAKGRKDRAGLDSLLRDATRRKFDIIAVWALDRLGRSLRQVVETVAEIEAAGVDVYLEKQGFDTSTPAGRLFFHVVASFSEFERDMLRERVMAGLARAKAQGTRSGKPIGRPRGQSEKPVKHQAEIVKLRTNGLSIRAISEALNISTHTVQRGLKRAKV